MGTFYRYVEGQGLVEIGGDRDVAPRVHVIGDSMSPTFSHADCKVYDSKSEYRKAVKAAGCELVGSEFKSIKQKEPTRIGREGWAKAVKESIEKLSR